MTSETAEDDASLASSNNSLRLSEEDDFNDVEANDRRTETDHQVQSKTRAVLYLKIAVITVLVLAGLAVALVAYFMTKESETNEFKTAFESNANTLVEAFYHDSQTRLWTTAALSASFTSFALANNQRWPNVTLPDFESRTAPLIQGVASPAVIFAPLVTKETRKGWEAYALANFPPEVSSSLLVKSIFGFGQGGNPVPYDEDSPGPFFPTYQFHSSEHVGATFFFDVMSLPPIGEAIEGTLQGNGPSIGRAFLIDGYGPTSSLSIPVFEGFEHAKVVGVLLMEVDWSQYFDHISLSDDHSMTVVFENTCGQKYSFHVQEGDNEFLGEGDLHDSQYDDMEISSSFDEFGRLFLQSNAFVQDYDEDLPSIPCPYAVHIYPDDDAKGAYLTNRPTIYAATAAGVFVFAIVIFILYDLLVERRQRMIAKTAAKSNAIIHSLFPENVRDRLFKTSSDANATESEERRRRRPSNRLLPENSTVRLKNFLSAPTGSRQLSERVGTSQPIADLFPNTTIMFADIAGFTAWSSEREPYQVFELLETLYSAFDKVARALGVFKVETIGDAYVAVTGLPDPADDHPVVMARFAYECQRKMRELTKQLEISLGPGTGELALRVGLHSGAVTAGVLRGDKSRFQLFGDTMNTAARMESTGQPDKIQVSQETADLLIAAEKEHWVKPREDLVMAKGKGEMQTYWLQGGRASLLAAPTCNTLSTASKKSGDSKQGKKHSSLAMPVSSSMWGELDVEKIVSTTSHETRRPTGSLKEQRLIDWNVEVLYGLLLNIVAARLANDSSRSSKSTRRLHVGDSEELMGESSSMFPNDVIGEVTEVVTLAEFDAHAARSEMPDIVFVSPDVRKELRLYVKRIASLYRKVPYHNFEHASHVTMSANKLIKRIVAPQGTMLRSRQAKTHHNATFGISSDPLAQFAVVFSALIHDVDHTGVPNTQLVKEKAAVALAHNNKSVAEQQSVYLGWTILMEPQYKALQSCIYSSDDERGRFRQLVINSVMATDLADQDLQVLRRDRWAKSFDESVSSQADFDPTVDRNRKATIVIEHLIQASDVAHTMQHWHTFEKWNERFFQERHHAFVTGRAESDPSIRWYEDQLEFFDEYVIPLARKLKMCGVFGVSSDEYLGYALQNRREWEIKGKDLVQSMRQSLPTLHSLLVSQGL